MDDEFGWPMEAPSVSTLSRCRACFTAFTRADGETLSSVQADDVASHLIHSRCSNCRAVSLIKLDLTQNAVQVWELPIELMPHEVKAFMEGRKIGLDDVIEIHGLMPEEGGKDFFDRLLESMP